jgi:rhodanese-related sulfurtransferase
MTKTVLFGFTFFIISITACAQADKNKTMTNSEFRSLLKSNPDLIVLDVRTAEELVGPLGRIENVIHIPLHELSRRIQELEKYRDREIAIICRTQNRSSAAVDILLNNGFTAKCVLGGMTEYSKTVNKE